MRTPQQILEYQRKYEEALKTMSDFDCIKRGCKDEAMAKHRYEAFLKQKNRIQNEERQQVEGK